MGKKSRRERNKMDGKAIKSLEERQKESSIIKRKIQELGLGDGNPDILEFYTILDTYCQGTKAYEGSIPIKGYQRILHYLLPSSSIRQCQIRLEYNKTI